MIRYLLLGNLLLMTHCGTIVCSSTTVPQIVPQYRCRVSYALNAIIRAKSAAGVATEAPIQKRPRTDIIFQRSRCSPFNHTCGLYTWCVGSASLWDEGKGVDPTQSLYPALTLTPVLSYPQRTAKTGKNGSETRPPRVSAFCIEREISEKCKITPGVKSRPPTRHVGKNHTGGRTLLFVHPEGHLLL